MKFMRAILLMLSFSLRATQSIGTTDSKADLESRQEKVIMKWLGTAGWEIELGKTIHTHRSFSHPQGSIHGRGVENG